MAPAKGAGNVAITYNSNALKNYINTVDLQEQATELVSTHLGSTAETSTGGLTKSTLQIGGDWSATLEGYLGPDSRSSVKRTTVVALTDAASTTVTLTWTASGDVGGWISNYSRNTDASGKIVWSATLNLSGLGVAS